MLGLIGLVLIYGFIYYVNSLKRCNILKLLIKVIFSIKNIFIKFLINVELMLFVVVVLVFVIYIFGMVFLFGIFIILNIIWLSNFIWNGFDYLFNLLDFSFGKWYLNILIIVFINMIVGIIIIIGVFYVFVRYFFKGKKVGLLIILVF